MKKLIAALTALTAFSCMLTACGSSSDSSDSGSSSSAASSESASGSSASEDATEDKTESTTEKTTAETTEAKTTEPAEKPTKSSNKGNSEVEDAFAAMVDSVNNSDVETYLQTMYPSKLLELELKIYEEEEGKSRQEMFDELRSLIELTANSRPMTYSDLKLEDASDKIVNIKEILSDLFESYSEENNKKLDFVPMDYLDITEAYFISTTFTDASGETEDCDFVAYNLKGEGWKFDEDLVYDFLNDDDDDTVSSDAAASSLQKAALSALMDMDTKGENIEGKFVIGSESKYNYNVPADFNTDMFKKYLVNYFDKIENYNYFIVCEDCYCSYAVVQKDNDVVAGIYPVGNIYGKNGPEMPSDAGHTIDDLFEICRSNLK